jgi:hypothetical protein
MINRIASVIWVLWLCCIPSGALGQDASADSLKHLTSVSTPEDALGRAYQLSGFERIRQILDKHIDSACISNTKYEDSTFPFPSVDFRGRSCWHVSLDSFYIRKQHGPLNGLPAEEPKHVDIFIDSASGAFIKAVLTCYSKADTGLRPEPPSSYTGSRMTNEDDLGLVAKKVPTTLTQALDVAVGPTSTAHQIIVYLVNYSHISAPACPYWIVAVRGVIPLPVMGGPPGWKDPIADRKVGRIQSGVDAITGELRFVREKGR